PWHVTPTVMSKNPIKGIDWAVGILELVGEISRVISFSFRLLGNIFAGQILLFVIAFLVPAISVVFFGLEFFVGLIQAVVFGLLALMFMAGASEHHGDDDDHHED
ncbi:MAG: F0F1 ATP synthase subunit A, partial [Candidatus Promineifilaceae bacterium]